jgi:hypothetical protein
MTGFLSTDGACDPQTRISLPTFQNSAMGVDLLEARRKMECAECGGPLNDVDHPRSPFCSQQHGDRWRHRRRYAAAGGEERARARAYYFEHREEILDRAAAKRGGSRRPVETACSECGEPLLPGKFVVCGKSKCRDARFRRTNPEGYAAREAAKVVRRREARKKARET